MLGDIIRRMATTRKAGGETPAKGSRRRAQTARSASRAAGRRSGTGRARAARGEPAWGPEGRTEFLIKTVGGVTKLALTLNVAKSQPSRWRTGEDVPSPEVAARMLDLEHVMALAMQAWEPEVANDWLQAPNGFLGGAVPLDVLRVRGSAEVIDALKATISGSYA